ncbi:hypothetical protein D3C77_257140 [compost metagenome]
MDNYIAVGNPLISEGIEVRDALALLGGHDRLVAKLSGFLPPMLTRLHGGQVITLRNHIAKARLCLQQS